MTAEEARSLFAYDRWANARMLDAVAALSPEQYTRDMGSSFASVQTTLAHVVQSEWIWLRRWKGSSPAGAPEDWETPAFETLREIWAGHERELSEWLDGLTDEALNEPIAYRNMRGDAHTVVLAHLVRHVINHSSYHRGQVTTMLRQLGAKAPALDLVLFHTSGAAAKAVAHA